MKEFQKLSMGFMEVTQELIQKIERMGKKLEE